MDKDIVERAAEALANQVAMRNGSPPVIGCLHLMKPEMADRFRDDARAALELLDALTKRIEELEKGLLPFALAAADLDDKHGDHGSLYEAPATLDLTAGHLRTARAVLDSKEKG